jgi:hypothetical protein
MTTPGPAEPLPAEQQGDHGAGSPLTAAQVIRICDQLLGDLGRRDHRFSWLRAPDGAVDAWLPVDAYYPSHRLVLKLTGSSAEIDRLVARMVPAHGLRLLAVDAGELSSDPLPAADALARKLDALGPAPERARDRAPADPRPCAPAAGPNPRLRASAAHPHVPPAVPRRGRSQAEAANRATRLAEAHRAAAQGQAPRPARPVGEVRVRDRVLILAGAVAVCVLLGIAIAGKLLGL